MHREGLKDVVVVVVDTNEIRNHSLHQLLSLWIIYNILSAYWLAMSSALMFGRSWNSHSKPILLNESWCARAFVPTVNCAVCRRFVLLLIQHLTKFEVYSALKCWSENEIKWIEKEEAKWRKQQWNHVWSFWWARDTQTSTAHTHSAAASKPIDRRRTNNLSPDKLWHFVFMCAVVLLYLLLLQWQQWIFAEFVFWPSCECTVSSIELNTHTWYVSVWSHVCAHTYTWYRPIVASRQKDENQEQQQKLSTTTSTTSTTSSMASKWISLVCFVFPHIARVRASMSRHTLACIMSRIHIYHQFFFAISPPSSIRFYSAA